MDSGATIGDWTVDQFVKFLQQQINENPPSNLPVLVAEEVNITEIMRILDQIQFLQYQLSVGAAGGASALPATPAGYFRVLDYTGQPKLIPYYNAS